MKKLTVRFYACTDSTMKYVGWEYADKTNLRVYNSWLSSGNSLKIGTQTFGRFSSHTRLLNALR